MLNTLVGIHLSWFIEEKDQLSVDQHSQLTAHYQYVTTRPAMAHERCGGEHKIAALTHTDKALSRNAWLWVGDSKADSLSRGSEMLVLFHCSQWLY